jgi:hypothetical protein
MSEGEIEEEMEKEQLQERVHAKEEYIGGRDVPYRPRRNSSYRRET